MGVHTEDRKLLGMLWAFAAFDLRSAPKIFMAIADAPEWVVHQIGVEVVLNYMDDFLLIGELHIQQCKTDLRKLLTIFAELCILVAGEKPTTLLSFLGIEVDTSRMTLRLPKEKIKEIRSPIAEWMWYMLNDSMLWLENYSTHAQ